MWGGDQETRLPEQLLKQNWDLLEVHNQRLNDMLELKQFHGSIFVSIARRRLVEHQDSFLGLIGKIQELQNEVNCMSDSKDFQDADSVRSGNSHVTTQLVSFPSHPIPEGMVSRSLGMLSRREGPSSIWDTDGISGFFFFCKSSRVFFSIFSAGIESMELSIEKLFHSSTVEKSERRTQGQGQRYQSGPSAKKSVVLVRETLPRIMEQTYNDCRFRIFTLTSSLHQRHFLAGR